MEVPPTKTCNACHQTKSLNEFGQRIVNGKTYPRTKCRPCFNRHTASRVSRKSPDSEYRQRRKQAKLESNKKRRASSEPEVYARFVLEDAKRGDKLRNHSNDLTVAMVVDLISGPCHYCGDTQTKRGLDRIDNSRGHELQNVLPACVRCNLTRGDMPFEAWSIVSQGMKTAREMNLFGQWIPGNRKKITS